jgi:metal-responsive CopG/Arc/MetJ family transcriptional regulator
MMQELINPMRIRLDKELDEKLNALVQMRGEAKSELCRRLLRTAVAQELAQESIDPILMVVRQAMGDVLKPVEERLAKINAKTAIAAATGMYMNQQVFESLGKNGRALHEAARKQAVAFVKTSNDQLTDEVGSEGNG